MSEKRHRTCTDIFGLWADLGQWSTTRFLYLLLPSTFSGIKSLNSGHTHAVCSIPNSHCFQSTSLSSQGLGLATVNSASSLLGMRWYYPCLKEKWLSQSYSTSFFCHDFQNEAAPAFPGFLSQPSCLSINVWASGDIHRDRDTYTHTQWWFFQELRKAAEISRKHLYEISISRVKREKTTILLGALLREMPLPFPELGGLIR